MCTMSKEGEALVILHSVLLSQIHQYRKYIRKPPRFVPFFKPLYWVPYRELRLCTRAHNIPIDIVML
jgi:tRNA(Ile)-lysidine synthase TilS/MesJ